MRSIACFISPHGFGHAARTCAVLEALSSRADIEAHIYSTVDTTFFSQSSFCYTSHNQLTDIGFFQKDAFHIDIEKTIDALDQFIPFDDKRIDALAEECQNHAFILSDISALGIAVARRAQIPSILLENFTWDWLYSPYLSDNSKLSKFSVYLKNLYQAADYHIQVKPVCQRNSADLVCGPIFREVREHPQHIRERLGCTAPKVALVTMGGFSFKPEFLEILKQHPTYDFIIAGQEREAWIGNNVLVLDRCSNHYHPDLINCADIAVFKCGYSTLAECYQVGIPIISVSRDGFAEAKVLEAFIQKNMCAAFITQSDFSSGQWLDLLDAPELTARKTRPPNGAHAVADFLVPLL